MTPDVFDLLAETRKKLAELEKQAATELRAQLRALPGKFNFSSADELIAAIRDAFGSAKGRSAGQAQPKSKGRKRRKRAVITAETRAQVKKLVSEKKTAAQISEQLGISVPSVQNIKKELGLVKARK
jgi:DNA-binding NarL/FixJ family response regulator